MLAVPYVLWAQPVQVSVEGLEGKALQVEITETSLMRDPLAARRQLEMIKARHPGIRIAIDDFGTGYSSLSYLHRFPVTAVKMDRSFVARLPSHGESEELIRAVLSIAESLRLQVVAEGIESDAQLARLKDIHCPYGQGYLFAHPMAAEEVERWVAARTSGRP